MQPTNRDSTNSTSVGPGIYKALVCVYMSGGMDSNDFLIPTDPTLRARYKTHRGPDLDLSLNAQGITTDWAMPKAFTFADNPGYAITELLHADRVKVIANIGNLVKPPEKLPSGKLEADLPPDPFAHDMQTDQWLSGRYDRQIYLDGWGGRILEGMSLPQGAVPRGFSFSGQSNLLLGDPQLEMGNSSALSPTAMEEGTFAELMRDLADMGDPTVDNLFVADYSEHFLGTISRPAALNAARPKNKYDKLVNETYPNLGTQFRTVIETMLAGKNKLQHHRQIFFVPWYGGWDSHTEQNRNDRMVTRFTYLSRALGYFQKLLDDHELADDVVTFTASEFSRTLAPNGGGGTDHGWGGQTLVMSSRNVMAGGPKVVGEMHDFDLGGNYDHGSRGQWIPTTAVVELVATLAEWFGVPPQDIADHLPDLVEFPSPFLPLFS